MGCGTFMNSSSFAAQLSAGTFITLPSPSLHRRQLLFILSWIQISWPPQIMQRLRRFKCLQMLPFLYSSPWTICHCLAHCTHCLSRLPCGPGEKCKSIRISRVQLHAMHIFFQSLHIFSLVLFLHFSHLLDSDVALSSKFFEAHHKIRRVISFRG